MTRPFDRFKSGGPISLGFARWGDRTARRRYGRRVFAQCGYRCVYCGYDMGEPYEAWLSLSVDHVVPAHLVQAGWPAAWINDLINLATCCRACNEFLNGYRLPDPTPPATIEEFVAIRDRIFDEKAERAAKRHEIEKERYIAGRPAGPSGAARTC